jgi:Protein of unknown function (DUF3375)
MRLAELLVYFETSPAIRLLRSPNAPFVADFLNRQFKQAARIAVPHSELLSALVAYREQVQESHPDKLAATADTYLTDWCSRETRWLQRFLEASHDEPVYQLTPHTEDVFAFFDRVLDKDLGFVGTESRLKLVIETLADLVVGSSDDPQVRLAHLRDEEGRIRAEIEQIETSGRVSRYRPAQVRERFATAVSLLRQLQGDFRSVEESFRNITAEVQQKQVAGRETRGGILEFALDSEDVLKTEDQGVSFYEFVRLILSPAQTERLQRIIHEVRQIPELQSQPEGLETVRGMVGLLQDEAERVMRTNQHLSASLRRLLDVRAHAERQRLAGLLQEIRAQAVALANDPPGDELGIELEVDLAVESPFRRTFWSEPHRFEHVDLTDFEAEESQRLDVFRRLAAMHRLDWREMRSRIRSVVDFKPGSTLGDLLHAHPPQGGVIEVLGYLQIARDDRHQLDCAAHEEILVPPQRNGERPLLLTVPLVTFVSETVDVERGNGHAE